MTSFFRRNVLILSLVLLVSFFAFSPCLKHEFLETWDDADNITHNPAVQTFNFQQIHQIFTTTIGKLYFPLTLLTFSVEYHFFGPNPFVFHLDNILLHLAVTALIFIFALRAGLSQRAAAFCALLFSIHPMRVESVAWITERKDMLYAFFYMLALLDYQKYFSRGRRIFYARTFVWGFLSVLAKPMAASLPLVMLAYDWLQGKKVTLKSVVEKLPHFLYIIPVVWHTVGGIDRVAFYADQAVLISIWCFVFYIRHFFFPSVLLAHYELPQPIVFGQPQYTVVIILFFLILYLVVKWRRNRGWLFAWIFYTVSIAIMIRSQNVMGWGNLTPTADRFMYLPGLGFCLFLGMTFDEILQKISRRSKIFQGLVCGVLIMLFVGLFLKTYQQTKIWKNEVTLWSYVIAKSPEDRLAYMNRALAYKSRHQYDLAIADLSKVMTINPAYYISGSPAQSSDPHRAQIERINTALANNPYLIVAHRQRGLIFQEIGRYDAALQDFNVVLSINPNDNFVSSQRSLIQHRGTTKKLP